MITAKLYDACDQVLRDRRIAESQLKLGIYFASLGCDRTRYIDYSQIGTNGNIHYVFFI